MKRQRKLEEVTGGSHERRKKAMTALFGGTGLWLALAGGGAAEPVRHMGRPP